ncbi:acyl carrier protein [Streptomyces uncialis]|uniref:Carrier domain-containing protein n=1 Tax=Streptomyces uncialis TaxID=1048205 RepID=A0A1Q4UYL6_9ACTN|nr:acyl carrier protein [Streptomyces uncialis]OKH90700.1 hypothetical protein AB852_34410 [Streptomyces uncialis]WTE09738.1 acyl carrier protein [Streptomyces uncialis]
MNPPPKQNQAALAPHLQERLHRLLDREFEWNGTVTEEDDRPLLNLPGVDSLGLLRAMTCIQKEFSVAFSDEELFDLRTVGDLRALLAAKAGSGP